MRDLPIPPSEMRNQRRGRLAMRKGRSEGNHVRTKTRLETLSLKMELAQMEMETGMRAGI